MSQNRAPQFIERPLTRSYTETPNVFLDYWMPVLGNGEFRVLCFITRKTLGWHKEQDRISLSQLATGTGLTRRSIQVAIPKLIKRGLLSKKVEGKNGTQITNYKLHIMHPESSNNSYQDTKYPAEIAIENDGFKEIPTRIPSIRDQDTKYPHKRNSYKTKKKAAAEESPPPTPPPKTIAAASLERIKKEERLTKQEMDCIIKDVARYNVSLERLDHILTGVFDPSKQVDSPIALIRKALRDSSMVFKISMKALAEKKKQDQERLIQENKDYAKEVHQTTMNANKGKVPFSSVDTHIRIEIIDRNGKRHYEPIGYADKTFKARLDAYLEKMGYTH
jgi:phage replication O-like protein O